MTASPNFDPNINLRKQIDSLMRDLDQEPGTSDIHARVGEILENIQKLGNQLNSKSNQLIQELKDKLIEIGNNEASRLDFKIQTVAQPVFSRSLSDLPEEMQREIFSWLSPQKLLANRSLSEELNPLVTEVAIEKINKDCVPLHELGLNDDGLKQLMINFGDKFKYLNFGSIQEDFFQGFPLEDICKYCPNMQYLSLENWSGNLKPFFTALGEMVHLEGLDLGNLGFHLNPKDWEYVGNALKSLVNLKTLIISQIRYAPNVNGMWKSVGNALKSLVNLEYLDLSNNNGLTNEIEYLTEAMDGLTKLEHFSFNYTMPFRSEVSPELIANFLHSLAKIPHINLSNNVLRGQVVISALANMLIAPKLNVLLLRRSINESDMQDFIEALRPFSNYPNFQSLSLAFSDPSFRQETLIALGEILKNAKQIVIGYKNEDELRELNARVTGVQADGKTPVKELFRKFFTE